MEGINKACCFHKLFDRNPQICSSITNETSVIHCYSMFSVREFRKDIFPVLISLVLYKIYLCNLILWITSKILINISRRSFGIWIKVLFTEANRNNIVWMAIGLVILLSNISNFHSNLSTKVSGFCEKIMNDTVKWTVYAVKKSISFEWRLLKRELSL